MGDAQMVRRSSAHTASCHATVPRQWPPGGLGNAGAGIRSKPAGSPASEGLLRLVTPLFLSTSPSLTPIRVRGEEASTQPEVLQHSGNCIQSYVLGIDSAGRHPPRGEPMLASCRCPSCRRVTMICSPHQESFADRLSNSRPRQAGDPLSDRKDFAPLLKAAAASVLASFPQASGSLVPWGIRFPAGVRASVRCPRDRMPPCICLD